MNPWSDPVGLLLLCLSVLSFFSRIQFALLSFPWFVSGAQSSQHGLVLYLGLGFFQTWRNCPPVAWTCCLSFICDGFFSFLLVPVPHTCCELCMFQGNCYLYSIAADPWENLGREQCSAQMLPGVTWQLSSLRFCGMRPRAGSAQNAELTSPVAVRNATVTCDTGGLCDTGVGPNVAAPWMISKKAVSSACISFSHG